MTLRNAFENLATEAKQDAEIAKLQLLLDAIATSAAQAATTASIDAMAALTLERSQRFPLGEIPYARTLNDAMRVVLDTQPAVSIYNGNSSTYTWRQWYDVNATNMIDQREQQRELANQTFLQARHGRWVIS